MHSAPSQGTPRSSNQHDGLVGTHSIRTRHQPAVDDGDLRPPKRCSRPPVDRGGIGPLYQSAPRTVHGGLTKTKLFQNARECSRASDVVSRALWTEARTKGIRTDWIRMSSTFWRTFSPGYLLAIWTRRSETGRCLVSFGRMRREMTRVKSWYGEKVL